MNRTFFISLFLLVSGFSTTYSQDNFDEKRFFQNLKDSYYYLDSTNLKNFTVLMTNLFTEKFAEDHWKNREIFPLQLIWYSPNRIFISEQGVPSLKDSLKILYSEYVSDLKVQVKDILINLRQFYIAGIYNSIPKDYIIKKLHDVVKIESSEKSAKDTINTEYSFGANGLCVKILTYIASTKTTVETIPIFTIIKTKWLITGWKVQILKSGEIESGYTIELKNNLISETWVPSDIFIKLQDVNYEGKTFQDVIKLRSYLFDQPLQLID